MHDSDTPRFTVNQIVLLQKLKQSGLNKDDILKGLEEMERLDEIGLGSPTSVAPPPPNPQPTAPEQSPTDHTSNGNSVSSANKDSDYQLPSPQSPPQHQGKLNTPANLPHHLNPPNHLMFGAHLQNPNQLTLMPPVVGAWPNTSQAVAVATAASFLQNGFSHGNVPHYPNILNGRGLMRAMSSSSPCVLGGGGGGGSTVVEVDDEKIDITEELEELFRRDQNSVKEDIRKFISERHISQSAIAKATRNAISQSYISQWLAQPQDISGQKKKAMYTWYIIEKRKPVGVANGMGSVTPIVYRSNESEDGVNSLLLKSKRGARFTWPKECLSILENYYNANSYPDECKREEIAQACNRVIQAQKPGCMLSELDKVTTVKVYNWFANRRKDDKRRRHIEHIESMSQHPHGSMLSPRRSSTASPSPSCNSNDSHPNDDARGVPIKEEQMTLALEMAAVNNSILALVNPHNEPNHEPEDTDDPFVQRHSDVIRRAQGSNHMHRARGPECQGYAA